MKVELNVGDIVQSLAGRDKGVYFSVMEVDSDYVMIADGRKRKVSSPKRKKIKHLKKVSSVSEELIERIKSDKPLGNERLSKELKTQIQKIQED